MKTKEIEKIEITEDTPKFKGYTIEEIRYQRALMGLRKEFCKAKVMESVSNLKPGGARKKGSDNESQSKWAIAGKVASKVLGNLNVLDYVLMGISAYSTVRKGVKMISRKKK